MQIKNAIASLAVTNIASSKTWYEALLGRAADSTPMPELAEWKFAGGGWLQVYQLPERAGNGSCTLSLANLEEIVAHADALGIDTSQRTADARVKTLMIADPDGNHIAFAETSDKTIAQ